jgi:hypothetical protein
MCRPSCSVRTNLANEYPIVMMLGRLERNKLYRAIEESSLDPSEFKLTTDEAAVTITHNSGSSFVFAPTTSPFLGGSYAVTAIVEDGGTRYYTLRNGMDEIPGRIVEWANKVKETLEAPDLWAEMRRSRELIADIQRADSSNTPFTQDEQRQIAAQLQEITKQVKEQFELTKEQTERIEEWRDEVVEAGTRMGRKDWLIYLLGTITALAIAATVPAGVGEHIFTMVIHALGHLFTGGSEPPRILT